MDILEIKNLYFTKIILYGDFDMPYVDCIVAGYEDAAKYVQQFANDWGLKCKKSYIYCYPDQENTKYELIKFLKKNGFKVIKTSEIQLGD